MVPFTVAAIFPPGKVVTAPCSLAAVLVLLTAASALGDNAHALTCNGPHVSDGDTIACSGVRVRIWGSTLRSCRTRISPSLRSPAAGKPVHGCSLSRVPWSPASPGETGMIATAAWLGSAGHERHPTWVRS